MDAAIKEILANLQKPAIHLGGTGSVGLAAQYQDILETLDSTLADMRRYGQPHMRDYYVLPDATAAYNRAVAEHNARIERIDSVHREFYALFLYAMRKGKVD